MTADTNLVLVLLLQHGIDRYPAGRGIGHQVMCEEGYAFPGDFFTAIKTKQHKSNNVLLCVCDICWSLVLIHFLWLWFCC